MMTRLNSWLSPNVMHALGWALIHSLWQCVALAALAAILMALTRRRAQFKADPRIPQLTLAWMCCASFTFMSSMAKTTSP